MKILISTFAVLCGALLAQAEARTETIEYKQGDATLEGYLALEHGRQSVARRVIQ